MEKKAREIWVDQVKLIACILVALWHFFQSLTFIFDFIDESFFLWTNSVVYTFHVPLFFICSGYLYQKYTKRCGIKGHFQNLMKKFIALGVPYFVFSIITWVLKNLFSGQVNYQAGDLADEIFLHPMPPYWYLYALFFIFAVTPLLRSKGMTVIALAAALAMKLILPLTGIRIFLLRTVMDNEIWFVLGMALCVYNEEPFGWWVYAGAGALFLLMSTAVGSGGYYFAFAVGLTACFAIVGAVRILSGKLDRPAVRFMAKYTMPIFLMHTIFAAGFRTLITRLTMVLPEISFLPAVQFIGGLIITFAGPIAAAMVMEKLKYPEFLIYPMKFIKKDGSK